MAFGAWISKYYDDFKETLGGVFAITVSNFIELNIKRGKQFTTSNKSGPVSVGSSEYWLLKTGDDPIIIKRRILKTNSDEINYYVYNQPVITSNGTSVTIYNYNEVTFNTPKVQYFKDPTFSSKGDYYISDYIPGASGVGGRSSGGLGDLGYERILTPNTDYLIEIKNDGSNPVTYQLILDWYEGIIYPLGDGV